MENKEIVNFSEFFGDNSVSKLTAFDKEDFKDIFLDDNFVQESQKEDDDPFETPVDIEDFVEDDEEPKELEVEDSLGSYENDKNYSKVKESSDEYFSVYKDKSEDFSCNVLVEGCKLNETSARLILETDEWTLMFDGDIDRYGKCNIPIKKLNIFDEGITGKIRLEVIAENTVFTPWEDNFIVKMSKKVSIQMNENRRAKPQIKSQSSIKVKVNR